MSRIVYLMKLSHWTSPKDVRRSANSLMIDVFNFLDKSALPLLNTRVEPLKLFEILPGCFSNSITGSLFRINVTHITLLLP